MTVHGKDNMVYSGPTCKSMTVEGDNIRRAFDHVGGDESPAMTEPSGVAPVNTCHGIRGILTVAGSPVLRKPFRFGWFIRIANPG
ncbi:MAG TPA: hypothetical protein DD670_03800 [Planctomycetaceae bacterium]|nr:hypothetical protein [Planctomycetaceae bacterium]